MKCSYPPCDRECEKFPNGTFKKHCSRACCAKDNALKGAEKKKATCIEKYGVPYPIGTATVREKIKDSVLAKYGVSNVSMVSDVKDKKKKTLMQNYGVDHPLKSDEIKTKVKDTLLNRYGVGHVSYIGKSTEVIDLLSDVAKIQELNSQYSLYSLSRKYGLSDRTLREILEKNNIEPIYHSNSSFEKEIYEYIRTIYTGTIVTGSKILDGKEIDIFLPDIKLGFECNGAYWHSESAGGRNKEYHLSKLETAIEHGIRLKQIWDFEWYNHTDLVKSMISHALGLNKRVYARDCTVGVVEQADERLFLSTTHLQGYVPSSVAVGLFHNNNLIAIMTFIKSRFDKSATWELLRFSCDLNTSVVGAASRMLKYFTEHNPGSIMSYSHRHISDGNLYKTIGFEYVRSTSPSYRYTKDYKHFVSRITYQKHKLPGVLTNFDNTLTEWDNMRKNGYDRIWDCGNDVWIFKGK